MQARADQIKAVFSLQSEEGSGVLIAVEGRFY
jgi:signal transduction histidine kinase